MRKALSHNAFVTRIAGPRPRFASAPRPVPEGVAQKRGGASHYVYWLNETPITCCNGMTLLGAKILLKDQRPTCKRCAA